MNELYFQLENRINRVINEPMFEATLKKYGKCLIDFQATWCKYRTFDALPRHFRLAILNSEAEQAAAIREAR